VAKNLLGFRYYHYLYQNQFFKKIIAMKKLLLLVAGGAFALSAGAQSQTNKSVVFLPTHKDRTPTEKTVPVKLAKYTNSTNNKTTAGGSRWYDYLPYIQAAGGALTGAVMPIWHNNQVLQNFTSGLDTINYLSAAQVINPVGFGTSGFNGWKDASVYPDATIQVSAGNAYVVDSIRIGGAYVKNPNRPTNIVDTLILTVSPSSGQYTLTLANYSWLPTYTNQNSLIALSPLKIDSINKTTYSDVGDPVTGRKTWKVPLFDADRTAPDAQGNITTNDWFFEVPGGGLNVAAGGSFAIAVTFKTGESNIPPATDTFSEYHNFMPLSSFIQANAPMKYFYYTEGDRNMSNMMFFSDSGSYLPSVIIEGINQPSYRYEYHQFAARITCATCPTVSVDDVAGNIIATNAFPNPATDEVRVPFSLKAAADVTVNLTNTMGQVVKSQKMGNTAKGEAVMSVSDLANGVYFYTVESNGQRQTGRVVVSH
jgi:hypothetical protein